ncbi:MAG: PKD domain-containing protein [Candidatus Aminicenantes bacterium]|nr:PKD domain-containing protein [Candidatus Aminicenantes bacterium]
MSKRKHSTMARIVVSLALALALAPAVFAAWSAPICIAEQGGVDHKKPEVRFSPEGKIYVVYEAGAKIHLGAVKGNSGEYVRRISESSLLAYEPIMWINKRGFIHIAWVECNDYNSNTQYIKYRFFNGSSWSSVSTMIVLNITGTLPGGFVNRKVENLRMAVDENNNVFLAYMVQPAARCQFVSMYGTRVRLETWPLSGRSKHPDVAVDSSYVHIAWQHLWGDYTVAYCRRTNTANGSFGDPIDVRDGIHRPRIATDPNRIPHVFYQDNYNDTASRISIYKYWTGNGFSPKFVVSGNDVHKYSNLDIDVKDKNNIFTMELAPNQIFFNWMQNGVWTGHNRINEALSRPDYTSCALSHDGSTAVVAYVNRNDSVYVNINGDGTPTPGPILNIPPIARFIFSPTSGLYPLSVSFNASASTDSDGQIVSYQWSFGDLSSTGKGVTTQHTYASKGRFLITLKVTDDAGATATATGEVDVLGLAPPLNVQYERHENRNLFSIEYLYRLTWNSNPRNEEIGAKIVSYKIYRRKVGGGGYSYLHTLNAGNLSSMEYLDRTLGSTPLVYCYAVSAVDSSGRESEMAELGDSADVDEAETERIRPEIRTGYK